MNALTGLLRMIRLVVSGAEVSRTDFSTRPPTAQLMLTAGEVQDRVPIMGPFGLAWRPPAGSRGVAVAQGGDRASLVLLAAASKDVPPPVLEEGEVALFAKGGAYIKLSLDGRVRVNGSVLVSGDVADFRGSLELIRELFDAHVHPSAAGPTGPPTVPMIAGAPGAGGGETDTQFLEVGSGPPPPSESRVPGSRYLDVASGEVYELADDLWQTVGSLQGPQGALWLTGEGAPPEPSGREGDLYLDSGSGDAYVRGLFGWEVFASLRGPVGPPGTTDHGLLTGLGDDDHPQYHNAARANAWLATKNADDIAEGDDHLFLTAAERAKLVGGEGSGLDADTLRGLEPADFALAVHTHSADDIVGGTLNGGTA